MDSDPERQSSDSPAALRFTIILLRIIYIMLNSKYPTPELLKVMAGDMNVRAYEPFYSRLAVKCPRSAIQTNPKVRGKPFRS